MQRNTNDRAPTEQPDGLRPEPTMYARKLGSGDSWYACNKLDEGAVALYAAPTAQTGRDDVLELLNSKDGIPDHIQQIVRSGYPNCDLSPEMKITCALKNGWSLDQIRKDVDTFFRAALQQAPVQDIRHRADEAIANRVGKEVYEALFPVQDGGEHYDTTKGEK